MGRRGVVVWWWRGRYLQRDGVEDEVNGGVGQAELAEQLLHRHRLQVVTLVGLGVLLLPVLHEGKELRRAALLEDAHERRGKGLRLGHRHLVRLPLVHNVRTVDQSKLCAVLGDTSLLQHLHKLAVRHQHLADQVDVVVTALAQGRRRRAHVEPLKKLLDVQRGSLTSVVPVAVHHKALVAAGGQKTAQDTLRQARAQNDKVILLVHVEYATLACSWRVGCRLRGVALRDDGGNKWGGGG